MRVYVDASGNDHGEKNILNACKQFLHENNKVSLKIYISHSNIKTIDEMNKSFNDRVDFIACNEALDNDSRYRKGSDSTTEKALSDMYMDSNRNCAFISCANVKHIALIAFGMESKKLNIPSALVQAIPTLCGSKRIMLDLGASIDPNLFVLSLIAKVFISIFFELQTPKIGFLNIGSESNKGLPSVIRAAQDYIKFVGREFTYGHNGFIEPNEILLDNDCNAVVCSGVHGNIAIKSFKSVTKVIASIFKENRFKAILAYPALKTFHNKFNYDFYNGALITRFSKLMVKAHGNSTETSFVHALHRTTMMFMPKFHEFYSACLKINGELANNALAH